MLDAIRTVASTSDFARRLSATMIPKEEQDKDFILSLASDLGVEPDEDEKTMLANMVMQLSARTATLEELLSETVIEVQSLKDKLNRAAPDLSAEDIAVIRRKLDQDLDANEMAPSALTAMYGKEWFADKTEQHKTIVAYSLINYFEARGYKVPDLWETIAATNGAVGA